MASWDDATKVTIWKTVRHESARLLCLAQVQLL